MAIPLYRAKQTTATTGTGTVTLDAVAVNLRSFQAAFGAVATRVRYAISFVTGFEVGYGDYDGGTPGTLTRITVIASSNEGALVNLPAGTKDVFAVPDLDRPLLSIAGTTTLALADLGNLVLATLSANATLNLPAIATVPPGAGFVIRNASSVALNAVLTIDPSGAELVDGAATQLVFPGESCEIYRVGSAWVTAGLPTGPSLIRTIPGTAVANIDFLLPSAALWYLLKANLTPASNALLALRTSADGGASFFAGATDYARAYGEVNSASTFTGASQLGAEILLSSTSLLNYVIVADVEIFPGDGAFGARVLARSTYIDTGGALLFNAQLSGNRGAAGASNAIRLFPTVGLFASGGGASLYGIRR